MIDTMKRELVDVISRYVEVDREQHRRNVRAPRQHARDARQHPDRFGHASQRQRQRFEQAGNAAPEVEAAAARPRAGSAGRAGPALREAAQAAVAQAAPKEARRRTAPRPARSAARNATFVTSTGRWRSRPSLASLIGIVCIRSAGLHTPDARGEFAKQILYLVLGVPVMIGLVVHRLSHRGSGGRRRSTPSTCCCCSSSCAAATARSARSAGSRSARSARFSRRNRRSS